jgi:cytochrome c oxidase cbb3-type subunit 3
MRVWLALGCLALVWPWSVSAAPDGAALFAENCAVCHQTEGRGGIGLPLNQGRLNLMSDRYITQTIRHGRPGRIMPSFEELSDAQVKAIVDYLRRHYKSKPMQYSRAGLGGDAKHGAELYGANCAMCHGPTGGGEGRGTGVTISRERKFGIMPPALNNPGFQNAAPDAMVAKIIKEGRPSGIMPAFRNELSDEDIADVVAYVRQLGKQAAAEHKPPERLQLTLIVDSPYDFKTTVQNVRQALTGTNFRIFPERYLEQGLTDEFSHDTKQVSLRFCNFSQLFDLLNVEPRLGVVLPCRITVVEGKDGKVQLIAANMRTISHWFNNAELEEAAGKMADAVQSVLEEATL